MNLPNSLTLARIFLVPLLVAALLQESIVLHWQGAVITNDLVALIIFWLAAATDLLDGYLARRWKQVTTIGTLLDPIADKIMIAAVILVLSAQGVLTGPYVGDMHVAAGLIILIREIAVSGLREFLGSLRVSMPVSTLAKWKTAFQMISLGALILGNALPRWTVPIGELQANLPHTIGLVTLWGAAALTVITGWDYLRVGLKHMD